MNSIFVIILMFLVSSSNSTTQNRKNASFPKELCHNKDLILGQHIFSFLNHNKHLNYDTLYNFYSEDITLDSLHVSFDYGFSSLDGKMDIISMNISRKVIDDNKALVNYLVEVYCKHYGKNYKIYTTNHYGKTRILLHWKMNNYNCSIFYLKNKYQGDPKDKVGSDENNVELFVEKNDIEEFWQITDYKEPPFDN